MLIQDNTVLERKQPHFGDKNSTLPGAQQLMIKSIGGHPMAIKSSGTLVLITEKKHAPWGHMVKVAIQRGPSGR